MRRSDAMNVSFTAKINYTYSPQDEKKKKPAVTEKKDFICKDTQHVRPLSVHTGQEERVAQYRIQMWGEMVYIAITREYSKW